jgi:hypothetical protein
MPKIANTKTCPKCSGVMAEGKGFTMLPAVETNGKQHRTSTDAGLPVQTYRCMKCGFVELYRTKLPDP